MSPQCEATLAKCRCDKDANHVEAGDKVHECLGPNHRTAKPCHGSWSGSDETGDLEIVLYPGGLTEIEAKQEMLRQVMLGPVF
jgi:hypothetical protein